MNSQIVSLLGLAGSGKDTVGQMFINKGFTRIAFADTLKKEYAELHGIAVEDLHKQGPIKELHRPSIIAYAEAKRKEDPLYWIAKAFAPYLDSDGNLKPDLKLVITDMRRISEIQWVFDRKTDLIPDGKVSVDAFLFRIDRDIIDLDGLTHQCIGFAKGLQYVHSDLPMIDATILNHGNLKELQDKVERIFKVYSF